MRALIIVLSLGLIAAATPPQSADPVKPAKPARMMCSAKGTTPAMENAKSPNRVRKLSEMPPARQIKAVVRTIDGCDVPIVVRENIGGN
jgi:hypothetical protein